MICRCGYRRTCVLVGITLRSSCCRRKGDPVRSDLSLRGLGIPETMGLVGTYSCMLATLDRGLDDRSAFGSGPHCRAETEAF